MIEAPGKLVIAGEYAVLYPGSRGLALAVGPGLKGEGRALESKEVILRLDILRGAPIRCAWSGGRLTPDRPCPGARFVLHALEALGRLVGPFGLELRMGASSWGAGPAGHRRRREKPGLGGSGASVACALRVADNALGLDLGPDVRFRVGYEAHRACQGGRGSGIDVAASTYGGMVIFEGGAPGELPSIKAMPWPEAWPLGVVFSGVGIKTSPRVAAVMAHGEGDPEGMAGWCERSNSDVDGAIEALRAEDWHQFCGHMARARRGLLELGEAVGMEMEGALGPIIDIASRYGVAKQSGAGGGDSALLFPRDKASLREGLRILEGEGYQVLRLKPAGAILG